MANKFNLINTIDFSSTLNENLRSQHSQWKKNNSLQKKGFTMIFSDFKDNNILSKIDGGALKLYVFLSLAAKNQSGESWHSIETIADYFEVQTRTVDKWFKNLVELDLIHRHKFKGKSHTTYLLPYEDTVLNHKTPKSSDYNQLVNKKKKELNNLKNIYGEIFKIVHLYQWRPSGETKGNSRIVVPNNILFIITKRENGILVGHKIPLKNLMGSDGVSEISLNGFYTFTSPLSNTENNIPGLALPNDPNIGREENVGELINLMKDLAILTNEEIEEYDSIDYGKISDFNYNKNEEKNEEGG